MNYEILAAQRQESAHTEEKHVCRRVSKKTRVGNNTTSNYQYMISTHNAGILIIPDRVFGKNNVGLGFIILRANTSE